MIRSRSATMLVRVRIVFWLTINLFTIILVLLNIAAGPSLIWGVIDLVILPLSLFAAIMNVLRLVDLYRR
jgi:hypothetical protein